ncbi:MAG: monooxygenase FAD-binding protein [Clostridiales bacterium]|nr:monooxygenase FAD-binding protein [Clostridiales bacterium]
MKLKVPEIQLGLDEKIEKLPEKAALKLGINPQKIIDWEIDKKAIDARRKNKVCFAYTLILDLDLKELPPKAKSNPKISPAKELYFPNIIKGSSQLINSPVVVGTGPTGLFAALLLAKNGYKPLVIERGRKVHQRKEDVEKFWQTGELNPESNVQFGEGGAGTFSDGKLTTRIKDRRVRLAIEYLLEAGAPKEIAYYSKPHVGTDNLRSIVKNMREEINRLGGKVLFESKLTDLFVEKGKIQGVEINSSHYIPAQVVIMAVGHSARDTYRLLYDKGVRMQAKPFAIGLRVEHPQHMIDYAQYGKFAGHPRLGAADYHLTYRNKEIGRSAYTFCMCPGGYVIGASSEEGHLAVNGMSNYKRDSGIANSAVVVTVGEKDYSYDHPLAGMEFQRKLEKKAYELGGGNFRAPVQSVADFIGNREGSLPEGALYSYKPGVKVINLRKYLPEEIGTVLAEALQNWDRKIKGFASEKAVLTAVETRTSAPLRILRNDQIEALDIGGLYPAGEGAGYAGGIVSSAVDGLRTAQAVMEKYSRPERIEFPQGLDKE